MWWVEMVATGQQAGAGALPGSEQWTMVWLSKEAVIRALSDRSGSTLYGAPMDVATLQLLILLGSLWTSRSGTPWRPP